MLVPIVFRQAEAVLMLSWGCLRYRYSVDTTGLLQVYIQPYRISEPAPTASLEPTVSLPPEYVTAALNFEFVDQGTEDFDEPWNIQLYNSEYLEVLQVSSHTG